MHSYQKHIGDYRRDTTHLSMLEHGAYNQLLDWAYLDESPIPRKTDVVFRRLRAVSEEEQQAVLMVLEEFFEETEAGWVHGRVQAEIASYAARVDRARTNGKSGGRPKDSGKSSGYGDLPKPAKPPDAPKPTDNPVGFSGLSEETQTKTNQEPITNSNDDDLTRASARDGSSRFVLTDRIREWARAQGIADVETHFQRFVENVKTTGVVYQNFEKAAQTAITRSWSKANERAPPAQQSSAKPSFTRRSTSKQRKTIDYDKDGRIL